MSEENKEHEHLTQNEQDNIKGTQTEEYKPEPPRKKKSGASHFLVGLIGVIVGALVVALLSGSLGLGSMKNDSSTPLSDDNSRTRIDRNFFHISCL